MLGIVSILCTFAFSLSAYYTHHLLLHQLSFFALVSSIVFLLLYIYMDLKSSHIAAVYTIMILLTLVGLYFSLRTILHRFDLSVGDPSDYFLAGICSITYQQDIGFFLPLTASITATGFTLFGLKLAPFINTLVNFLAVPLLYIAMRQFHFSLAGRLVVTLIYILLPLTIWFASTSFSDPFWQLMLLVFIILSAHIIDTQKVGITTLILLTFLLGLLPFLRGEAVLYFAFVTLLAIVHYHKHHSIKDALLLFLSLAALLTAIYITLQIRSGYLLNMQFSRIIPHITQTQLTSLLYGLTLLCIALFVISVVWKKYIKNISFIQFSTLLLILFKLSFAYYYSQTKNLLFTDLLFGNEFGFIYHNFGMLLAPLILIGLASFYVQSFKSHLQSFVLLTLYTIFYVPFIMQKVSFFDAHAFLYYWNRYYLSALMIVHLFALAKTINLIYDYLKRFTHHIWISLLSGIAIIAFSIPFYMYPIVLNEPHQKNASIIAPWLKKHIGNASISVIYDKTLIYKQNKGHIGINDVKYLTSRLFSVYKINAVDYQKIAPSDLGTNITLSDTLSQRHYLLCIADKPCKLPHQYLSHVDTLKVPLQWREHYSLNNPEDFHHTHTLDQSDQNNWVLHFDLYKITPTHKPKFHYNKKIYLTKQSPITDKVLNPKWLYNHTNFGAWSLDLHPSMQFPFITSKEGKKYQIVLHYFVFNADANSPRRVTFRVGDHILKEITTTLSKNDLIYLDIPPRLVSDKALKLNIDIDTYPYQTKQFPYGIFIEYFIINKL